MKKATLKTVDDLQKRLLLLDEGKGTAYERYALNDFLERLVRRHKIHSVLELPADGIMGVPGLKSLAPALNGCEVTLCNPSEEALAEMKSLWEALGLSARFVRSGWEETPFPDRSFDLVWNFCVFERFLDPGKAVREMARVSARYLLIEVQNVFNIGLPLHRAVHLLKKEAWDHGEMRKMMWRDVAQEVEKNGFKILKVGGTDLPPWPDINMKFSLREEKVDLSRYGEDFQKLRPRVKTKEVEKILEGWRDGRSPVRFPLWMAVLKAWYFIVERNTPEFLRVLLSHHPFVLAERKTEVAG